MTPLDEIAQDVAKASGLRVKVERKPGMPQFGWFLGLYLDERDDVQAVVRLDGYGLMLVVTRPSTVEPVTSEQEELHK